MKGLRLDLWPFVIWELIHMEPVYSDRLLEFLYVELMRCDTTDASE